MSETARDVRVLYSDGDWAALYVDGELRDYGDEGNVTEAVFELFGVQVESTNDWLRGDDSDGRIAKTLDEVRAFKAFLEGREQKAEEMRRQARELLQLADELQTTP